MTTSDTSTPTTAAGTRIVASAPLRADLAGGTIDIWPLYLLHPGASTVNVALRLRARVEYEPGGDHWDLRAGDRGEIRIVPGAEVERQARSVSSEDPFALFLQALEYVRTAPPGRVTTHVSGPSGGGLGGSSALLIACCGLVSRAAQKPLQRSRMAALARDLEVRVLRLPTGVQDYYPAIYGGVQQIRYGPGGVRRRHLGIDPEDLERRMVLAFSGRSHRSGPSNWSLFCRRLEEDPASISAFAQIADAAEEAAIALESHDWQRLGEAMNADWRCRVEVDPDWAPVSLRRIEDAGRAAGAVGAKACGAASGGCMLFLVDDPRKRRDVERALASVNAGIVPFRVARSGLRVRRVRVESDRRPN